jgi:hypothetical protein
MFVLEVDFLLGNYDCLFSGDLVGFVCLFWPIFWYSGWNIVNPFLMAKLLKGHCA